MMILSAQGCVQLKMTKVAQLQTRGVLAEADMHALLRPLQRTLEVQTLLPRVVLSTNVGSTEYHYDCILPLNIVPMNAPPTSPTTPYYALPSPTKPYQALPSPTKPY